MDSTGLKIYGEGEWKVRQHGVGKRRTWRKVHLAVDAHAKDVIGVEVTTVDWADCEVFEGLVEQVEGELEQIDADGAYDTRQAYAVAAARETKLVVPPRENAVSWEKVIHGMRCWSKWPNGAWRDGKKNPAIIDVVSRKTPCTASSNCSATAWLPA